VPAAGEGWAWYRLDPDWAHRLVADAGLPARSTVLDVGAGDGVIAAALLAAGHRVVAVERHPGRVATLRARFGDALTVVRADAADLRTPRRPFHVVANPPFGITAPLLRRLLHPGSRLVSAHLVLQRQVVRRWASPDAPGAPRWSRDYVVVPGRPVPRRAFRPHAPVDVRVLCIRRR
jgi:23S rRNA (adenine-N6)-dimethyltransferase